MAVSTPVITPDDLSLFLGATVDDPRALVIIADAQALCEAITGKPLPAGAEAVVRRVAVRAYVNPSGVTQETVGPYTVQRHAAGVYLTAGDRRTLRSLMGGGGAFSIDLTPSTAMTNIPPWDYSGVVTQVSES